MIEKYKRKYEESVNESWQCLQKHIIARPFSCDSQLIGSEQMVCFGFVLFFFLLNNVEVIHKYWLDQEGVIQAP